MMDTAPGMGTSNKATLLLVGGGLLIGLALGLVVFSNLGSRADAADVPAAERDTAPEIGALAPDFSLVDVASGETVTLSELQGQPVVINFWATWCGPCRVEMPAIQATYEHHQSDNLAVLAVNFDEPEPLVTAFRDEMGLTFNILLDPGAEIQSLYRIRAYPTTYFVGSDGVIASLQIGVMTEDQLASHLSTIIQ